VRVTATEPHLCGNSGPPVSPGIAEGKPTVIARRPLHRETPGAHVPRTADPTVTAAPMCVARADAGTAAGRVTILARVSWFSIDGRKVARDASSPDL